MADDNTEDNLENFEEELEEGTVVLHDAEGNSRVFAQLGFVEEDNQEFAILSPLEQIKDTDAPNFDVFVFKYTENEDGSQSYAPIEDDDLFKRVTAKADQLLNESGSEEEE